MIIFWHCESVLFVDFLSRGTKINGLYSASLLHRLRSSIRKKRRGKLTRSMLLLQGSAPVHKSEHHAGFIKLNYPVYSPDLALRDYQI